MDKQTLRSSTIKRMKSTPLSALLDYVSGESSDDSDFRIEDHCEESVDESLVSDDIESRNNDHDSDSGDVISFEDENKMTVEQLLQKANTHKEKCGGLDSVKILICSVCLGDCSDENDEIVECDGCGVTVHEGCYGVSENESFSSTISSSSTIPWFCEACRAGIENPTCELCPNIGGIFKETDTGKWVHLVCALYIPGVAFGEVDTLSCVTLFEMAYSKWGARVCSLCSDQRFMRTGVCVCCDAGLCRTYFHVTCGQREGLLSECHVDEVDQANPFYAHCKLHSDKLLTKKRRCNWLAMDFGMAQRKLQYASQGYSDLPEQLRIQQKLAKQQQMYCSAKLTMPLPWVPTQKMARKLTSSVSVYKRMLHKASLSGVDSQAWGLSEAQTALADIHRKWFIAPAFSVEFIGYYLDRNNRLKTMKQQLTVLLDENSKLVEEQKKTQSKYDQAMKENSVCASKYKILKMTLQKYHDIILKFAPQKKLLNLQIIGEPVTSNHHSFVSAVDRMSTPAALRASFYQAVVSRGTPLILNQECGICRFSTDQHLLAKCDTCHLHYHLGCLNPPLTRMPKKTKLIGWQCSECDKESSGSEMEYPDPEAPRQLRKHKDLSSGEVTPRCFATLDKEKKHDNPAKNLKRALPSPGSSSVISVKPGKKRRKKKHFSSSLETPDSLLPHKQNSVDIPDPQNTQNRSALKIFFKSNSSSTGSAYPVTPVSEYQANPISSLKKQKEEAFFICSTCNLRGSDSNIVRCDECLKGFHFHCLDPPVKKSPKVKGYSWHCTECDPSESDSD